MPSDDIFIVENEGFWNKNMPQTFACGFCNTALAKCEHIVYNAGMPFTKRLSLPTREVWIEMK